MIALEQILGLRRRININTVPGGDSLFGHSLRSSLISYHKRDGMGSGYRKFGRGDGETDAVDLKNGADGAELGVTLLSSQAS